MRVHIGWLHTGSAMSGAGGIIPLSLAGFASPGIPPEPAPVVPPLPPLPPPPLPPLPAPAEPAPPPAPATPPPAPPIPAPAPPPLMPAPPVPGAPPREPPVVPPLDPPEPVPPAPFMGAGADEQAPDSPRVRNTAIWIHAPGRNIGITLTGTIPAPGGHAGRFRSIRWPRLI